MRKKILAASFKGPSHLRGNSGQSLVEALFVLQTLLVFLGFILTIGIQSWNQLCLHWITHETTLCLCLEDPTVNCRAFAKNRARHLIIGFQSLSMSADRNSFLATSQISIEQKVGPLPLRSLGAKHSLRRDFSEYRR